MRILLASLFALFVLSGTAQTEEFLLVKGANRMIMRPVFQDQVLKGYWRVGIAEKVDRKNKKLIYDILDVNLNKTHSITQIVGKFETPLNALHNGVSFCIITFDLKSKATKFTMYNEDGEKIGEHIELKAKKRKTAPGVIASGYYSIPSKGFVFESADDHLVMLNNDGSVKWKKQLLRNGNKKKHNAISVNSSSEDYITMFLTAYDKLSDFRNGAQFQVIRVEDGSLVMESPLKRKENNLMLAPYKVEIVKKSKEFYVFGETYSLKKDQKKSKKTIEGYFLLGFNEKGDLIKENYPKWKGEIGTRLGVNEKGKLDGNSHFIPCDFIRTNTGEFYLIGEQVKKSVNAGGMLYSIANGSVGAFSVGAGSQTSLSESAGSKVDLYSDVSSFNLTLLDMIYFHFDKDLKLKDIKIIPRKKSKVFLPSIWQNVPLKKLYSSLRAYGFLSHEFTVKNEDRSKFSFVYTTYNRKNPGAGKCLISHISLSNGEIKKGDMSITTKPKAFRLGIAKPGHILINTIKNRKEGIF